MQVIQSFLEYRRRRLRNGSSYQGEWRIIYVAKITNTVYILHVFRKKTQKTRREDIELAICRYRQIGD